MTGLIKQIALASVLMTGAATSASAAIVTNGSFESGLTGWNVINLSGTTPGIGITTVVTDGSTDSTGYNDAVPSYDLGHAAFFVDDNAVQGLWQNVSLVGGTQYTLSFGLFGTESGDNNQFGFAFSDTVLRFWDIPTLDVNTNLDVPVGAWKTFNYNFTPTTTGNYVLNFGFLSGHTPAKDVLLDGVSIAAVPEPATWGMMIAGLGLVGFAMRRRTTNVQFA